MPDALFSLPRLAGIYDALHEDRSDLDHYEAIVDELGARTIVDVGCGTGTFACRLALRSLDVVGVDPAAASLDVARAKVGAERVRWLERAAHQLPPLGADLAVMTGNVAQVFLTDAEWRDVVASVAGCLRPGGHLVFEVRDPARRGWEEWTRELTYGEFSPAGVGRVDYWVEVLDVALPLVTFRQTYVFHADGAVLTSDSTLRFRPRHEIESSLRDQGLAVVDVRDAPDRPGKEFVFIAASGRG